MNKERKTTLRLIRKIDKSIYTLESVRKVLFHTHRDVAEYIETIIRDIGNVRSVCGCIYLEDGDKH